MPATFIRPGKAAAILRIFIFIFSYFHIFIFFYFWRVCPAVKKRPQKMYRRQVGARAADGIASHGSLEAYLGDFHACSKAFEMFVADRLSAAATGSQPGQPNAFLLWEDLDAGARSLGKLAALKSATYDGHRAQGTTRVSCVVGVERARGARARRMGRSLRRARRVLRGQRQTPAAIDTGARNMGSKPAFTK